MPRRCADVRGGDNGGLAAVGRSMQSAVADRVWEMKVFRNAQYKILFRDLFHIIL